MKYVRQFLIILSACFAGELLRYILPLPIPASVYGLVVMFCLLLSGVVKLHHVSDVANFFIQTMPLLFIPPAMAILNHWDVFSAIAGRFLILCFLTTIVVMGVTGRAVQWVMKRNAGDGR
ncbi:CidA/LrgA family protein [Synergistaceae bacterium OttesenSCG-928-D05]|nr:CidA/LrgA family protein [Synergistaceae bacterium OttesenSCG-928-D05]